MTCKCLLRNEVEQTFLQIKKHVPTCDNKQIQLQSSLVCVLKAGSKSFFESILLLYLHASL
jgi:hypothetical protein